MQETVLGQVVGQCEIPRQFAQEISHVRLVAPDQLAEGCRVLGRDSQGDEILILGPGQCRGAGYFSLLVKRHMIT